MTDPVLPGSSQYASAIAPLSTIATAMLFGTITFTTSALAARTWLTGDSRALNSAFKPHSSPLDTSCFESLYTLLHHFTIFGIILFFAYICEQHPPFPHTEKSYDRDHFIFLTVSVIFFSFYTVRKNSKSTAAISSKNSNSLGHKLHSIAEGSLARKGNNGQFTDESIYTFSTSGTRGIFINAADTTPENDVLNRNQTEEWKGWMQFVFLMYHYYSASEVYNAIRVMITCYVWMTGFGNFSFFYLKGDYSIVRVMQMIWRLNFLAFFLCLSQGTTYILYYICPLHTYFFLIVYFTMRISKNINYSKFGLRFKMAVVALLIYFIWDVDSGIFRMIHLFLGTNPTLGATNGIMWEWYFRTALDHWSAFLGMIFAANYPIISLFYRKLEALPFHQCWLGKASVALLLLVALGVWITGPFQQEKYLYNTTNPYFGFIPLITYVYLRNLTPILRSYSLALLQEIGKTTLETYLMQHHIWLTSNAKTLLTMIPGYPKVNMLVVTLIYFYTSRRLYKLTLFLRAMLLPNDSKKCMQSLITMVLVILFFQGLAFFLNSIGFATLQICFVVSVVCGSLLFKAIMDRTWRSYRESLESKKESDDDESRILLDLVEKRWERDSIVARISPPIIGTMVVLIIGLFWHGSAVSGSTKICSLPATCDVFANDGQWIPIDICNGETLGAAYRTQGVSNFATCKKYVWGWGKVHPHCRFTTRSSTELKKELQHRRLLFIGDSMTRNMYHAFCRQLGVEAGQYDATGAKHADYYKTVDNISVDFQWAPLAVDQLVAMKKLSSLIRDRAVSKYDFVALGGGAWDRLHLFATDEDKETHRKTLTGLTEEMMSVRSFHTPVVWVTPTTINTLALNTEEKRVHMTEKDMTEMREIYEEIGILSSASFVVSGPAFSEDRVSESFDGIHYPHGIYDAGAQILANALDWLLSERRSEPIKMLDPGLMSNPFLGLMMLCLCFIGLIFFDPFLGFTYVASIFVTGVLPSDLYTEAFTILHDKMKLPPIMASSSATITSYFSTNTKRTVASSVKPRNSGSTSSIDDEIAALLGSQEEMELKSIR